MTNTFVYLICFCIVATLCLIAIVAHELSICYVPKALINIVIYISLVFMLILDIIFSLFFSLFQLFEHTADI